MQSYQLYQPPGTFQYYDSRTGEGIDVNFTNFFNVVDKDPKIYLFGIFLLSISLLVTYLRYNSYMKQDKKDYRVINSYHITLFIEAFLLIACIIMGLMSFFKHK
jgi:hypothetical protein